MKINHFGSLENFTATTSLLNGFPSAFAKTLKIPSIDISVASGSIVQLFCFILNDAVCFIENVTPP